jgi:ABC-2 type transport system permease protein
MGIVSSTDASNARDDFSPFASASESLHSDAASRATRHNKSQSILDQAGTQESRQLLQKFENSDDFTIVARVFSDEELYRAIVAGKAHVGIKVPADYSQRLQAGQTAQLLILVDGSESSVAAEAVNVGNAIALRESLERALGNKPLPVDSRPRVLFNPNTRSANCSVPGLMVVLCQMMATTLAATAIVREKESGTLEQLFLTPVRSLECVCPLARSPCVKQWP